MKLTELCIKRPVLATVLSLLLLVVGIVTFDRLQVRQYPKTDQPVISITTRFEGASPDIVETQVTKILENALAGIEGIDEMSSRSEIAQSSISIRFRPERSIDSAANDVRDRIGRARAKLPQDVQSPEIRKADADAAPMLFLALYSDRQPLKDVHDYAKRVLESQLEVVSGVAAVDIWGGGDYHMYIRLDPMRMAAYRTNAEDVSNALKQQNVEKPAGSIITRERDIVVTTKAPLKTEEEFRNVIIREHEGYLVRISDVADEIKFDAVENQYAVRYNGRDAVTMAVTRQSIANPLSVSQEIRAMLPKIRQNLPLGMHAEIAVDQSIFIERSIKEVGWTILEASLLVILVIFIFLRSFRASIIPIVTIPLSLIGTFALMYLFGFTINILTLLALVMAIGLVVDDAIVVLENIYRHIEEGMSPMDATFKGSKEIGTAVVTMTVTLAAVYAPIALMPGMTGKIFTEFAMSLAGAVILSGFIALTLSPMMCARLLKVHKAKISQDDRAHHPLRVAYKKVDLFIDRVLNKIDQAYTKWLTKSLSGHSTIPLIPKKISLPNRAIVLLGCLVVTLTIAIGLWFNLKQDLSPYEDHGFVKARAFPPQGASLNYINKYMKQADDIFKKIPQVERRLIIVQSKGDSTLENYLVPWEDRRGISSQEISNAVKPKLENITGFSFRVWGRGRSLLGGSARGGQPIDIIVQSTKSFDELLLIFKDYVKALGKLPGIKPNSIYDEAPAEEQEIVVRIDRDKAAALNIKVSDIGDMLDILISGRPATYFKSESHRYPVTVELAKKFRQTRDDISSLYIRAQKGNKEYMVPLAEVIKVEKHLVPTEISHFGGLRSIRLFADVNEGHGLGEVLDQAIKVAQRVLPEGSRVDLGGESKRFKEESANIILIFVLAILSIYLVLSAQYESFVDPLIIMLSVPLSIVGGILTLVIAGGQFNLFSKGPFFEAATFTIFGWIGVVTLIGLITKHGILIVEFANQLLDGGEAKSRVEAVIKASEARLRPILMTTFAMVLGAVPLALASGAGAEVRQQIGWVIVGGMSFGTLFTLFIVPAVYTFLSRRRDEISAKSS